MIHPLQALSPLDGRYRDKVTSLEDYFSEGALIRTRVHVEVEWLIFLCNTLRLENTRVLSSSEVDHLRKWAHSLSLEDLDEVKAIEKTVNHDVKSVEYFIKAFMEKHSLGDLVEFVHFACTSEDINNLSYGLMLKEATQQVMVPMMNALEDALRPIVEQGSEMPMLSRTHGQPATPTTMGKEIANVLARLNRQSALLESQDFFGKMNGAVGNWNAHRVAYPEIDWPTQGAVFVKSLGLTPALYTTQIEPHDYLAEFFHTFIRYNTILIDFNQDVWSYISRNYLIQRAKEGEVGSSTMPHKVNPIDFENSEGNLGIANALLGHFATKLPISRLQRDLTDSTVLRNIGVALGYSLLSYQSTLRGLGKIVINEALLREDLEAHWEVLAEALQTVMRRYQIEKPYEKLKELTRGKGLTPEAYRDFVDRLDLPEAEKKRLLDLTPSTYLGFASELARKAL